MTDVTGLLKIWIWYTSFFIFLALILGFMAYPAFKTAFYNTGTLGEAGGFTYLTSVDGFGVFAGIFGFFTLIWLIITGILVYKTALPT